MTTRFDSFPRWLPRCLARLGGRATAAAAALVCGLGAALAQSDEPPPEVTGESTQSGRGGSGLDLGFDLNVADNLYMIWLAGALVAAIVGALFHYRAQLESFIRRGVHPDRFGWSVYIAWFGAFLLLAFFVLANADAGVHLALLVAFIVICLAGFLAGRLLWQFALGVLLLMCVAGLYRYWAQVA